jgi:ferrous iron transport protein A
VTISDPTQVQTLLLDDLADAQEATVVAVQAYDASMPAELLRRLVEIGFLPGERVRIVARGALGGAPLAVRIGTSTFALRRLEARCVQVALRTAGELA